MTASGVRDAQGNGNRYMRKQGARDMRQKWCAKVGFLLIATGVAAVLNPMIVRGQAEITSFNGNGELQWDDPGGTGTHYAVQWASAGLSNWMSW